MPITETPPRELAPTGGDPFSRLHHMSTTAGVGAHDYVAVSTLSVIAAVAGILGFAAFMSPVLLVIPAFAMVCAIAALIQIGNSGGTQVGRPLAILGLVIAFGISGTIAYQENSKSRAFAESKEEIGNLFSTIANLTAAGDYKTAYDRFGPAFHERVSYDDFEAFFRLVEPTAGRVKELSWNKLLEAGDSGEGGNEVARAVVMCGFTKGTAPAPANITLVRRPNPDGSRGQWQVEAMSPFFDKPVGSKPPRAASGPAH